MLFLSTGGRMFEALRRDKERYADGWYRSLGFWVVATYRFGEWARGLPLPLRKPLRALYLIARLPWTLFLHVTIDAVGIGPGLCLIHPHCIIIGTGVKIGRDCLVFHEVTIGTNVGADGVPTIGDGVDLYAGARVLGPVAVGEGSMIGANCVITRDVPPHSVVLPSPVRAVKRSLFFPENPAAETVRSS